MSQSKITAVVVIVALVGFVLIGINQLTQKQSKTNVPLTNVTNQKTIRYLPLGDSYTIGEGVAEKDRWPNQLAAEYHPDGKQLEIISNPSVTGYTTQDLIDQELPLVKKLKPDFVTVLIGVNDYVQGVDVATFDQHLRYIVAQLQQQLLQPQNILLVTIPDYAKTSSGARFGDPVAATAAITHFNQIISTIATDNKLVLADVFPVSQQVVTDSTLIARDGLHPSPKQYQVWAKIIYQSLTVDTKLRL